ncbi:MAG: hypothetical protein NDI69_01660 [Bacteriovoracaceae bacterium]|nr:hypothetical protein [Bacteriovoracaceae bacterium]
MIKTLELYSTLETKITTNSLKKGYAQRGVLTYDLDESNIKNVVLKIEAKHIDTDNSSRDKKMTRLSIPAQAILNSPKRAFQILASPLPQWMMFLKSNFK